MHLGFVLLKHNGQRRRNAVGASAYARRRLIRALARRNLVRMGERVNFRLKKRAREGATKPPPHNKQNRSLKSQNVNVLHRSASSLSRRHPGGIFGDCSAARAAPDAVPPKRGG